MADSSSLVRSDPTHDVFESIPHDVALLRPDGHVEATNRRWARTMRDPLAQCQTGADLLEHLRSIRGQPAAIAEHLCDGIERVLTGRASRFELQYEVQVEGSPRWFLLAAAKRTGGAVVTHTDTTVHHTVQDYLAEMAFHDGLTGLPNRTLIVDRLRMSLIRAHRTEIFPAVMFIDLDGFKSVNDTHGHAMGDEVLIQVSERLASTVREGDTCGRWGGDEFVLLIDLRDPGAVHGLIDRTRRAFVRPLEIDGNIIEIGLSIGVAVSTPEDRVSELIARADQAMYEAKRSGSHASVAGTSIDLTERTMTLPFD